MPFISQAEILRLAQVEALCGLRKSTIYSLIAAGEFPRQILLTSGRRAAVGWLREEVNEWIEARIKASRGAA